MGAPLARDGGEMIQDSLAVETFVGDPVKLTGALAAFGAIYALGIFCAIWVLIRSHGEGGGGGQATLTKLGTIVFSMAISAFVWMMFSAAFLGIGDYEDPVDLAKWLMTLGITGAISVKAGTTVLTRQQIKSGHQITENGD